MKIFYVYFIYLFVENSIVLISHFDYGWLLMSVSLMSPLPSLCHIPGSDWPEEKYSIIQSNVKTQRSCHLATAVGSNG